MIARASIIACLLVAPSLAPAQDARTRPFDVSLSMAHTTDLSPLYQQGIRAATVAYRGDLPDYSRFITDALTAVSKRPKDFDPFSGVVFTLSANPEELVPRR